MKNDNDAGIGEARKRGSRWKMAGLACGAPYNERNNEYNVVIEG